MFIVQLLKLVPKSMPTGLCLYVFSMFCVLAFGTVDTVGSVNAIFDCQSFQHLKKALSDGFFLFLGGGVSKSDISESVLFCLYI